MPRKPAIWRNKGRSRDQPIQRSGTSLEHDPKPVGKTYDSHRHLGAVQAESYVASRPGKTEPRDGNHKHRSPHVDLQARGCSAPINDWLAKIAPSPLGPRGGQAGELDRAQQTISRNNSRETGSSGVRSSPVTGQRAAASVSSQSNSYRRTSEPEYDWMRKSHDSNNDSDPFPSNHVSATVPLYTPAASQTSPLPSESGGPRLVCYSNADAGYSGAGLLDALVANDYVNIRDSKGQPVLHVIVKSGDLALLIRLVESGVKIAAEDLQGKNALQAGLEALQDQEMGLHKRYAVQSCTGYLERLGLSPGLN